MEHWFGDRLTLALALIGMVSLPARADDAAALTKLDMIEKRLAHIEAMEQVRGPKPPFAAVLPSIDPNKALSLCHIFGYAQAMTNAAPGTPGGTLVVCYGP